MNTRIEGYVRVSGRRPETDENPARALRLRLRRVPQAWHPAEPLLAELRAEGFGDAEIDAAAEEIRIERRGSEWRKDARYWVKPPELPLPL